MELRTIKGVLLETPCDAKCFVEVRKLTAKVDRFPIIGASQKNEVLIFDGGKSASPITATWLQEEIKDIKNASVKKLLVLNVYDYAPKYQVYGVSIEKFNDEYLFKLIVEAL